MIFVFVFLVGFVGAVLTLHCIMPLKLCGAIQYKFGVKKAFSLLACTIYGAGTNDVLGRTVILCVGAFVCLKKVCTI